MKHFILSVIILVQAFSVQSKGNADNRSDQSGYPNDDIKKPVLATVEELPNYIWHLFASSNLWEKPESSYGRLYGKFINSKDVDYLNSYRKDIVWGNGRSGKYAKLLFFMPLGKSLEVETYIDYLDLLSTCNSSNIKSEIENKYARNDYDIDYIKEFPFDSIDLVFFNRFKTIVASNYDSFHNSVWPEIQPILERDMIYIDQFFCNNDVIKQWEELINMPYEADRFSPVLSYANAIDNLPSANNLSSSRNNFGAVGNADNYLLELVIHEVGIYILMPVIIDLFSKPNLQTSYIQDNNLIYQAVESYIEFLKKEISGTSTLWQGEMHGGGSFDFEKFNSYYKNLQANNQNAGQILEDAIMQFSK